MHAVDLQGAPAAATRLWRNTLCALARFLWVVSVIAAVVTSASADSLTDVFSEELAGLELEPVGEALAKTVASTYPVASASSSVTYAYNPRTEIFERQTRVLGPIIGERAQTIGRRQIDVSLSYSYVRPTTINGADLDDLENRAEIDGRVISFPLRDAAGEPTGIYLADGRFTTFLPLRVGLDLAVEAQILSPSVTYGVTPNLDVNITLPLLRTYLRAEADTEVPDPRLPRFTLSEEDRALYMLTEERTASDDAVGVGDLLLRAKYLALRGPWVDLAGQLGLSLPTGNDEDLQGSGTTRVQPTLILSRVMGTRFEPFLNLGMDLNCDDVDSSVARWALGSTVQLIGPLTTAIVFLGRHELDEQVDPIQAPFFFQIERNDIFDVSVGFRYLVWKKGVIAANVLVPMNEDGLRAAVIPTLQFEYVFASPI